ncbi:unnamed protein product [Rhizoctonia solani]|uniref:F-box domain-containing protein n=1 Tax=Rhizoctonia solani TaxID=456999 RepID=A0A8H3DNU6_9AGAM|nr:unnamed protein product [Rhizoctonia solani]
MANQLETQMQKIGDNREPINRLPPEILSRIFVLCKRTQNRERGHHDIFCLTILPSICQRWRMVALNTKSLWSLVTLSDGSPFHFSALCLDRSGTTTPLDIEISLSRRLWGRQFHPKPGKYMYLHAILDGLDFIVARGGSTSRWRSFWLHTPENIHSIDPQIAALDFIGKHPLPALERLELKYDSPYLTQAEERLRKISHNRPLFHAPPPSHLKVATLEWIPNPYLFASPDCPQLVGLTCLEIKFPAILPNLEHIHALLAANPRLRVLSIDTRLYIFPLPPNSEDRKELVHLPKINMPNLRALALLFSARTYTPWWEHSLLLMLDAPNVESLRFWLRRSVHRVPRCQAFVDYLVKGTNPSNPRSLFPSLTGLELFVENDTASPHDGGLNEELLVAYPTITTLILPWGTSHRGLGIQPWLVPCLNRLLISTRSAWELREIIVKRHGAGLGPQIVEVPMLRDELFGSEEQMYLEVLNGLDIDVRIGYSKHRVREVLGFDEP